jgi:hypothetical protein
LSVKVTPLGSVPLFERAGVGDPVVVTVNDPAESTVNVVLFALVIVGAVPELTVTTGWALVMAKGPVPMLPLNISVVNV